MPLQIENENPVLLNADFDSSSVLYLIHESSNMASTAPHIQLDLTEPGVNNMYHTQFKIADFVEGTVTQNVYAHRVLSDGGLTAWSRVSGTVESPQYDYNIPLDTENEEFDLMALAVASGGSAPTYTTQSGAEQAGARTIRIKIVKHGSRPRVVRKPT